MKRKSEATLFGISIVTQRRLPLSDYGRGHYKR